MSFAQRLGRSAVAALVVYGMAAAALAGEPTAAIGPGEIARLAPSGDGRVRPDLPEGGGPTALAIDLPARADGATGIVHRASGMRARWWLEHAGDAPLVLSRGLAVYAGGYGEGSDVVVRVTRAGIEDFVVLERMPPTPKVRYRIAMDGVAGLRLVARSLELLDKTGAPRLRMAPPWLLDRAGRRVPLSVTIAGCAYDTDPRSPWGRAPTPPGAAECVMDLEWGDRSEAIAYPAVVDPLWVDGATLAEARATIAVTLEDGRVMLAGGRDNFVALSSVEIYDPTTDSWAMAAPLPEPRHDFGAAAIAVGAEGSVLVAGGCSAAAPGVCGPVASSYTFDVAMGTWSAAANLGAPRASHRAFRLQGTQVMVVGGRTDSVIATATTEIFDAAQASWSAGPPLSEPRIAYGSASLGGDRIFVVGGVTGIDVNPILTARAEIYDPSQSAWQAVPDAPYPRYGSSVTALVDGRVLVLGGSGLPSPLAGADVFDPMTQQWSGTGASAVVREEHAAALVPNGWIVAAGGCCGSGLEVELYHPESDSSAASWTATESLVEPRRAAATAVLPDGALLVAGGLLGSGSIALATTVLFRPWPSGEACAVGGECASGYCVDGVCCEQACETACHACSAASGSSADGLCAAVAQGSPDPRGMCLDAGADSCGTTGACALGGACALRAQGGACGCPTGGKGICDGAGLCTCEPTACIDEHTLATAEGETLDCAPYRCTGASCAAPCNTATDCVSGYACDREHRCVALVPAASVSGCDCGATRRRGETAWSAAFAVVAALARRVRTRRDRSSASTATRATRSRGCRVS